MGNEIVIYEASPDTRLQVKIDRETVWLSIDQMSVLLGRDKSVIGKHVRNVFSEGELDISSNRQNLPISGKIHPVAFYSLDVIISVGYRVKSVQGTRFRQWATRVLREMLLNRVDELRRIGKLEHRVDAIDTDIKQLKGGLNYLVQQLSTPPPDPPRRRIGFGADENDTPTGPYGRV